MINFVKVFEVNRLHYTFQVRQVLCGQDNKYFVSGTGADNDHVSFEMKRQESGAWKAIDPCPLWIDQVERALSATIEENEWIASHA